MTKNLNDEKCHNSLLSVSKLFCVFIFFLFQSFQAQIFVSAGTFVYGENDIVVSLPDSLIVKSKKSKIYVSSGVRISDFESSTNYDVAETPPPARIKATPKKHSVLHLAKAKSEKKIAQNLTSKKENSPFREYISAGSNYKVYFTASGHIFELGTFVTKKYSIQLVDYDNFGASLVFGWIKLALRHFKRAEILTAQNKYPFSVRPPPFRA